jgi:hypothetical protein
MSRESALKAVATRRQNQAMGITSAAPKLGDRPAGLLTILHIEQESLYFTLRFEYRAEDGSDPWQIIPKSEIALPSLRFTAYPCREGYVRGSLRTVIHGSYTTHELGSAYPLMQRVEKFLALAFEETEDDSFEELAANLAAHFRVSKVIHPNGSSPRGAARLIARKLAIPAMATYTEREAAKAEAKAEREAAEFAELEKAESDESALAA